MASTSATQVPPSSLDTSGLSVATASRDTAVPRAGSVYTSDLQGAVPVWFHPLNTGQYVMAMSAYWGPTGSSNEPTWVTVDPATGTHTGLARIPRNLAAGFLTLNAGASRGDYLFLLSKESFGRSLLQHFRVTNTGALVLQGEEWMPARLSLGLYLEGNYLWVFGKHESGTLAVARRNWGRIGAENTADMGWQYRTERGWSSDPADLAPLPGSLPADGPCSVASLGNRYFLVATAHVAAAWSARGYVSRMVDSGWSRNDFTVDLGSDAAYLNGTAHLQPQLSLTPGYTVVPTTGGATVLTSDATKVQVLTGSSPHSLALPPQLSGLEPFLIYNQSTADVTVVASGGATVGVVERGTGASFTPTTLTPDITASWTRGDVTDRAPRARSGFPYVATTSPDHTSWRTAWGVLAV